MVNFEDEEGYAVLSAVDFLAPIIAVMDEGNADSTLLGVIGRPIDPDNDRSGHAWVIDGYIHRLRGSQSEIMMHCNMGWGGKCDGYYVSELFDTTQVRNENGEILPPDPDITPTKYCKNYRIVYYDKPSNN